MQFTSFMLLYAHKTASKAETKFHHSSSASCGDLTIFVDNLIELENLKQITFIYLFIKEILTLKS